MASEMARAAKALMQHRSETFESRHPIEESKARLEPAIAALALKGATRFTPTWRVEGDKVLLDAEFVPATRVQGILKSSSMVLTLLLVASAWALLSPDEDRSIKFLLPLFTALSVLAFPFVALALNSQREAEESRIRRAIRKSLVDEPESRR